MTGFIVRRLFQAILVVIGLTIIVFLLRSALPGNLARAYCGSRCSPPVLHHLDVMMGLNRPLYVQYWKFLVGLAHGNLGFSYLLNQSVDSIVQHSIMRDVVLLGIATAVSMAISVPIGLLQAYRRNTVVDHVGTVVAFFFFGFPDFVFGLLLVSLFAIHWHIFPATATDGPFTAMFTHFRSLVLPIATEVIVAYGFYSRFMRSAAIDSLTQDYIKTARAKGLSDRQVLLRHVTRNSLIPMATLLGLSIPTILTAGLLIEEVFNFPGVAFHFVTAATTNDYPTVIGITVIIGLATVAGNLIADISYAVLDPRIRYS